MNTQEQELLLKQGMNLLVSKRPKEAIETALDPLISFFENESRLNSRTYSARTLMETASYLSDAAAANEQAVALTPVYAYAYFYKSYALTELGEFENAEIALDKALQLSPLNAQFLGEKGHSLARTKLWDESLTAFRRAESAARTFSPESLKIEELCRALRGQGFALIELKQLTEAVKVYMECLSLDANDTKARSQLGYTRILIAKTRR